MYTLRVLALLFLVTACAGGGASPWQGGQQSGAPAHDSPSDISLQAVDREMLEAGQVGGTGQVKVAILLPLSGQHARLGQAMLNAAQIALFDLGFDDYILLPKDTRGTPDGTAGVTREALDEGAQMILGPVFSGSVRAAQKLARAADVPMVAFSTDWTLANRETFLIGFLPFDQVERVVRYATARGLTRQGVLAPKNSYGDGVVGAYRSVAPQVGVGSSRVERFNEDGRNLAAIMQIFVQGGHSDHVKPYDAVLLPVGGAMARQVGSFLEHYDLPAHLVRRLGTGLMDDVSLASDHTLEGAWFAAPSLKMRAKFEKRYQEIYHDLPPRIASLAYDTTALSIILAKIGIKRDGRPAYGYAQLTDPNGFSGVDGIFRFRPDGISERGLAVLEFKKGKIVEIDPAPRTFQRRGF